MKKYITAILVVLILLTACENKVQTGTVTIRVSTESNSRTVAPDKADTAIAKYVVQGLSGAKSFKNEFTSSEFTLSLDEGDWSINIDAYGSDDKLVAKTDSQTISVIRHKNTTAIFQLNPIFDGTGTFNFKLGIPKDATAMNKIQCSLTSADGTLSEVDFEFDFTADATIDGDYSIFTKTLTVPAGSYNLNVETTNVFDDVYGIPINDSVIVQTEQATDYEHIWDMAFFPEVTISVNNNGEYYPGYLYVSSNSASAKIYCSIDGGSFTDITSKISSNYCVVGDDKGRACKVIATEDITKWSRGGNHYFAHAEGPAGGAIFYDCDADNDYGNADGLTSNACGWRYLEAAPEDLSTTYIFGYGSSGSITSTSIGTGKENTSKLIKAMGTSAKTSSSSSATTTDNYAARMASLYSLNGNTDWFLPSKDELNRMYLVKKHIGNFVSAYYWSSSESNSNYAWDQDFSNGGQHNDVRDSSKYVRPLRAFR